MVSSTLVQCICGSQTDQRNRWEKARKRKEYIKSKRYKIWQMGQLKSHVHTRYHSVSSVFNYKYPCLLISHNTTNTYVVSFYCCETFIHVMFVAAAIERLLSQNNCKPLKSYVEWIEVRHIAAQCVVSFNLCSVKVDNMFTSRATCCRQTIFLKV